MDRVAVDLGPIQIYWYSIFIFIGLLVASILIFKEAVTTPKVIATILILVGVVIMNMKGRFLCDESD